MLSTHSWTCDSIIIAPLEQFVIAYTSSLEKLRNLDSSPPDRWIIIRFIMLLKKEFPAWADRSIANARVNKIPELESLILEIKDEARDHKVYGIKAQDVSEGTALYGNKTTGGANKDKKKKAKCKHCKQKNPKH
jgi:hypothetical protein